MAPLPTAPAPQPPPELPADPKLSDAMSNYLRTFALWCRKMFQDKLDANAALPGILLQAYDKPSNAPPSVFMLEVSQAGHLALAPAALGSGDLGVPVMIGSGDFLPLSGGTLSGTLTVKDTLVIDGTAEKSTHYSTNNLMRFYTGVASGDAFWFVAACDDAGNYKSTPLTINRTDGSAGFQAQVTVAGAVVSTTGVIVSRATSPVFQFQNTSNANLGQFYYESSDASLRIWRPSGAYVGLMSNDYFQTSGTINALKGIRFADYNPAVLRFGYDYTNNILNLKIDTTDVYLPISNGAGSYTQIRNQFATGGYCYWQYVGGQMHWLYTAGFTAERLKSSRAAPRDALQVIEQIPVREIDLIDPLQDDPLHFDFAIVPDDIRTILPEAFAEALDNVASLRTDPIVALLVRAVQQLSTRVAELEAR